MEDRFKQERKSSQGDLIVWKALVRDFPLLGKWTGFTEGKKSALGKTIIPRYLMRHKRLYMMIKTHFYFLL